jgi:fermentation-respiration switch protein FrsA (DUF1100 family)
MEARTIFYPMREIEFLPKEINLDYEDIFLKTPDSTQINGWFIPSKNSRYTILFCHGNAGNISHRLEKIKFFYELGCNIFIFDYRGYGRSKGRPSEKGLYLDAKTAYDYLLSRNILPEQIVGYGESLGGAIIIDLAFRNMLKGIIIDSTPSSAKDMVKVLYSFLPHWIFSSRLDSENKIKSISIPKLIIHSANDEIVPYNLGRKLYENASQPKYFLTIHGGHNSCFFESQDILREKIAEFLHKL